MMRYPLVTIMIPAYNQANYLPQAISSALSQDYENLEVIVSDDNSTDNSGEIMKNYQVDPRIRYFKNPVNLGRVKNYKETLENRAQGEWAINLDADDHFTDFSFISDAIRLLQENGSQVVFVQAGHTVKSEDKRVLYQSVPDITNDYKLMPGTEYFLKFNHFSHLATLFNRKKAIEIDFYRYDILSADIESFLRLSLHGEIILMKRSVGIWLHHQKNASKALTLQLIERNMLRIEGPYVYAKSMRIFSDGQLLTWRNSMTRSYLLQYLEVSFRQGDRLKGYIWHVIRYYPQVIISWVIPKAYAKFFVSFFAGLFRKD